MLVEIATTAIAVVGVFIALCTFLLSIAVASAAHLAALLDKYSSSEMDKSLRLMREVLDNCGGSEVIAASRTSDEMLKVFWTQSKRRHSKFLDDYGNTTFEEYDQARRFVHHYYKDAHSLWKARLLLEKHFDIVLQKNGIELMLNVVELLSKGKHVENFGKIDAKHFDWIDEIRSRALRLRPDLR